MRKAIVAGWVVLGLALSTTTYAIAVNDTGWVRIDAAFTNAMCQSYDFDQNITLHNSYCTIIVDYGNCRWQPNPATGVNECWCPAEVQATSGDCADQDFGDFF